jgi:hypothetical protein
MTKTKTPSSPAKERSPSKRSSSAKTKKVIALPHSDNSLSLIDPPGVAPISGRKYRPVPALLPDVRAAREQADVSSLSEFPTDEPTPLPLMALNPQAVSLNAFVERLAARAMTPAPEPISVMIQHVTKPQSHVLSSSARQDHQAMDTASTEEAQASPTPQPKLRKPQERKSNSTNLASERSVAQTLAERLEMARLARDADALPSNNTQNRARDESAAQPTLTVTAQPAPVVHVAPNKEAPSLRPMMVARNTLLGVALAYVDDFQLHIAGPVASLWRHRSSVGAALIHVFIPLLLTYIFSHWTPSMQAIFLEGGMLSNLGKLCWLFVVSAFGWTLAYILGARVIQSLKFDWGRFERIGRGFMSPHRDDQ